MDKKRPGRRAARDRDAYHHGDLRAALVRATLELVEKRSLDAVTLREVARTAGVSAAAPYHHFKDKDALLGEVAEEGFRELTRRLQAVDLKALGGPNERLAALGGAYVRFALDRPAHFRVMFRVRTLAESESGSGSFALMREAVADVMASRGIASHGRVRTITAWALVHGFAVLALEGPLRTLPRRDAEALGDQVIALTVSGLTSEIPGSE